MRVQPVSMCFKDDFSVLVNLKKKKRRANFARLAEAKFVKVCFVNW